MRIAYIVASQDADWNLASDLNAIIDAYQPSRYSFKTREAADYYCGALQMLEPQRYHAVYELHALEEQ